MAANGASGHPVRIADLPPEHHAAARAWADEHLPSSCFPPAVLRGLAPVWQAGQKRLAQQIAEEQQPGGEAA